MTEPDHSNKALGDKLHWSCWGQAAPYRHGNLRAEALKAATRLNHFVHREALLDAVATEAYLRLAATVAKAKTPEDYTARYVRFALANRALYALMTSRPHATMKHNPPLQQAVHKVISEAMRIFARDIESPAERRRAVMKVYITLYGGISLYAAGVLDQPSEKALIAELAAMNAKL
jgi:Tetracyclin repressor-like, C-terminal domain